MPCVPADDRFELQELGARYAVNCDTKRYSAISELWAPDGTWDETIIGLPLCEGRAAIHEFFCGPAPEAVEFIHHIASNHVIDEFDGQTARGTTHLYAEGCFFGNRVRVLGYYADEFVKVDGRWLFQRRELKEIAPSEGFPGLNASAEGGP
jgi:hypothetical protein